MRAKGAEPWPRASTRVAGVIGEPVGHSLSPLIHNAAFSLLGLDWVYVAFPVRGDKTQEAIEGADALGIEGLSVTMPHKSAVARCLPRLSPVAKTLGAVNTVVRRDGGFVGENTDGDGFIDWLTEDLSFEVSGCRTVVFGAGGAGRAIVLALAARGASEIVVVNRTAARAAEAAALAGPAGRVGVAGDVASAELVVNATPVGMAPARNAGTEALPPEGSAPSGDRAWFLIDSTQLGPGQLVVDLVYQPVMTPLVEAARRHGARAQGGLGMLVRQAARAFSLWTGQQAPVAGMFKAVNRVLDQ